MSIIKNKSFLNISCLLFLICFTTLILSPFTYAQVGLTPGSVKASTSSFPPLGSTGFGAGTFSGNNFGATSFGMPNYGGGFGMPSYGGSFSMPSYTGGFSMPNYGGGFSMPSYTGGFSMPSYSAPAFGATNFGLNSYGAPAYGATNFGLNSYGAPAYGAIGYGLPSYGASAFGATGFGVPSYGMAGYGAPMSFGPALGGFGMVTPMGFGLPMGGFGLPVGYGVYNPYGYQPTSGRSSSSNTYTEPEYESGFYPEDELPNIKGYWSGKWEAFETDKEGVVTDPNNQIVIAEEGELAIHIKSQKSSGGKISGTIEITGWDIGAYPDWEGESEETELTGWLDESNGWFNIHYFYFTGTELKSDYSNLISDFLWNFHNLEINASESGIFGQFRVRGTVKTSKGNESYDLIGKFQAGKYIPEK